MRTIQITEATPPLITHTSPFSNDNNGYPMWFKKEIDGDIHIINVCHNQPIKVGDLFNCRESKTIQIDEILETRKPKGQHSKDVMFYSIKGEVVNILR